MTRLAPIRGSALFVTIMTLGALSLLAAHTLLRVSPRFQEAHQTAGWEEARIGAETGIDAAMGDLLRNAAGGASGQWEGWSEEKNGIIGPVLDTTLNALNGVLSLLGLGLGSGGGSGGGDVGPIFLDNLTVTADGGAPTEIEVKLWALRPGNSARRHWYRIRAMATCGLPPAAYRAPGKLDATLRRLSLREMRPQLKEEEVGRKTSIPAPSVSRVIEVVAEPILPFELGIWMRESVSLGTSGPWTVDSYDSGDPAKSSNGLYPEKEPGKIQENGSVASNLARPASSPYGPLIEANGALVRGIVATNGGDNPETETKENVSGARSVDAARVRDDFIREMNPVKRPSGVAALPPPILGLPFLAGSETAPTYYRAAGDLTSLRIAPPASGRGAIVIMVNGDLDLSESVTIPPNVTAQVYVRGDVYFKSHSVNAGATSSRRAAQLQIYGESSAGQPRKLRAHGNASIYAAFYGPDYEVRMSGNVEWFGAVGARSFEMAGGGNSGFHYDEALGMVGPPISFRIARYVEDVRR